MLISSSMSDTTYIAQLSSLSVRLVAMTLNHKVNMDLKLWDWRLAHLLAWLPDSWLFCLPTCFSWWRFGLSFCVSWSTQIWNLAYLPSKASVLCFCFSLNSKITCVFRDSAPRIWKVTRLKSQFPGKSRISGAWPETRFLSLFGHFA